MNRCSHWLLYIYEHTLKKKIYSFLWGASQDAIWKNQHLWVLCWHLRFAVQLMFPPGGDLRNTDTKINPGYYQFYKNLQLQLQEWWVNIVWKTQLRIRSSLNLCFGISRLGQVCRDKTKIYQTLRPVCSPLQCKDWTHREEWPNECHMLTEDQWLRGTGEGVERRGSSGILSLTPKGRGTIISLCVD